jgi:hypothetical protein
VIIGCQICGASDLDGEWMMSIGLFTQLLKQILILLAIAFFFYAAYQGVVGDGGSTSVFTGVGALVIVLIGSYFIDKFANSF